MELYFIPKENILTQEIITVGPPEYVVDVYESCIWTRRFGSYFDFQVVLPATQQNKDNIHLFDLVYRSVDRQPYTQYTYDDGFCPVKNVMMIEKIIEDDNNDKHTLTISGRGFEALFARMITWNKATIQGKLTSVLPKLLIQNGISVGDGAAYINYTLTVAQNCSRIGDYTDSVPLSCRNIPMFLEYDDGDVIDYQDFDVVCDTVNDYLGDTLTQILKPLNCYWYFTLVSIGGQSSQGYVRGWGITLHIKKPWKLADPANEHYDILFSKDNDTMLSSKYTQDATQMFNCGQIVGEGTGADQIRVAYPYATGYDLIRVQPQAYERIEAIIDESSYTSDTIVLVDQYKTLLVEQADYQKVKNSGQSLEVELNLKNPLYTYGDDDSSGHYDIGNVVGFKTSGNVMATARLVEMIESEDGNGTVYTPTFDEWTFY